MVAAGLAGEILLAASHTPVGVAFTCHKFKYWSQSLFLDR